MIDSWDILYPGSTNIEVTTPWLSNSNNIEIDLRIELHKTLYGSIDEIAKGRQGLLRVARVDNNGDLVKCPCRDEITDEPDKDFFCKTCYGFGYLWNERKIVYYRDDDSVSKHDESYFYMEYFENPTRFDCIIEVALDMDGQPKMPVRRELYYPILFAEAFRSDTGRIEYWRCRAKLERKWSVWYGTKTRQHEPTTRS
jgi:hypothetical protein